MGQASRKACARARSPRARSLAEKVNARVLALRGWIATTQRLFSSAPAFDMGGDDVTAARHLEMLDHYADQFSRALFRLDGRKWRSGKPERERRWRPTAPATGRDARLPPIGTTLTRKYKGRSYSVAVTAGGLVYAGRTFKSISAVGKAITGSQTNGYAFFGLLAA